MSPPTDSVDGPSDLDSNGEWIVATTGDRFETVDPAPVSLSALVIALSRIALPTLGNPTSATVASPCFSTV